MGTAPHATVDDGEAAPSGGRPAVCRQGERGMVTQLLGWPGQLRAFSSSSMAFSFLVSTTSTTHPTHFSRASFDQGISSSQLDFVKENKLVAFMMVLCTLLVEEKYRRPQTRKDSERGFTLSYIRFSLASSCGGPEK